MEPLDRHLGRMGHADMEQQRDADRVEGEDQRHRDHGKRHRAAALQPRPVQRDQPGHDRSGRQHSLVARTDRADEDRKALGR
jgi:hypothetical protein